MKRDAIRARGGLCWASWVLLVLFLSACTAPGPTSPLRKTSTTATVAPLPSATPPRAPVDLATAWGQVTIHRLPTAMGTNQVFVFADAATPDGQWLVGALEPRENVFLTSTRPSYLVLYNVSTLQVVQIHRLLTPQHQVLWASADAHWIVWSEAADQPYFFDWTLFAYNRQTRQVQQVAQAVHMQGRAVVGPYPMPVVDQDLLVWGQAIGDQSLLENLVVKQKDLTTGQVTTLATKAKFPGFAWPWVFWNQLTTDADGVVQFKNLSTGAHWQLHSPPRSLAVAGNSLAYSDLETLYLLDDMTQSPSTPQLIKSVNQGDFLQFVTLNDRLIGWTEYAPFAQVWDRAEGRLVTLPAPTPAIESFDWVGGHTLEWQESVDQKSNLLPAPTLYVIDTARLPVLG